MSRLLVVLVGSLIVVTSAHADIDFSKSNPTEDQLDYAFTIGECIGATKYIFKNYPNDYYTAINKSSIRATNETYLGKMIELSNRFTDCAKSKSMPILKCAKADNGFTQSEAALYSGYMYGLNSAVVSDKPIPIDVMKKGLSPICEGKPEQGIRSIRLTR